MTTPERLKVPVSDCLEEGGFNEERDLLLRIAAFQEEFLASEEEIRQEGSVPPLDAALKTIAFHLLKQNRLVRKIGNAYFSVESPIWKKVEKKIRGLSRDEKKEYLYQVGRTLYRLKDRQRRMARPYLSPNGHWIQLND